MTNEIRVDAGNVMVVKAPKIEVVTVLAWSVRVVDTISMSVKAGRVYVDVNVDAGKVTVFKDPKIEVVMVLACKVKIVVIRTSEIMIDGCNVTSDIWVKAGRVSTVV